MLNKLENFSLLVEKGMQSSGRMHMKPVIEKEILYYDILFALDNSGLLEELTFQGGTSLRLCYGSPRLSEDLDFAGGYDFNAGKLLNLKKCLEQSIGARYGLSVTVKEPKELAEDPKFKDIKVNKWQVNIVTAPAKKDIPAQKINIEVANIPSYSKVLRPIEKNYDFLPDGYDDVLVMVETLDEIMADKLISLVNCQKYIRNRDIWDLRWLKQQNAKINLNYINLKIKDYHISDYLLKLDKMTEQLEEIIMGQNFINEMSRFIPMEAQERTLKKDNFKQFLAIEIKDLLLQTKEILQS